MIDRRGDKELLNRWSGIGVRHRGWIVRLAFTAGRGLVLTSCLLGFTDSLDVDEVLGAGDGELVLDDVVGRDHLSGDAMGDEGFDAVLTGLAEIDSFDLLQNVNATWGYAHLEDAAGRVVEIRGCHTG